ncbi:MAG: SOS cell division inhibitor SulA [Casimicrobiaceae bacterium]|nr:SOS cell division inhibitor SulA [Casimicrobiaceae bacterium]MDW8312003.1 cell division protein [Burkholderiales bacterium]
MFAHCAPQRSSALASGSAALMPADAAAAAVTPSPAPPGVATGFAVLDAFLPWGGWPVGAMSEILTERCGAGELSLLLPAMARLAAEKRPIVLIGLPHEVFAPALLQAGVDPHQVTQIYPGATVRDVKALLWSSEQILRSGSAALVVLWSLGRPEPPIEALRRLHLAGLGKTTSFIHYRAVSCRGQPSPAWLRCGFWPTAETIELEVFKCRGRLTARPRITLDRRAVEARLAAHLHARLALKRALSEGLSSESPPPIAAQPQPWTALAR